MGNSKRFFLSLTLETVRRDRSDCRLIVYVHILGRARPAETVKTHEI